MSRGGWSKTEILKFGGNNVVAMAHKLIERRTNVMEMVTVCLSYL